jgi:hypothetical protein
MITFIAPVHQEVYDPYLFITSMLLQKDPHWKAIIYSNGHNPHCKAIVGHFNDERIRYKESPENSGAWGCYNRIDALNNMVDTEYVCQTSIQDYFTPNAVSEILKYPTTDLIYWDSLHNHIGWDKLTPELKHSYIDWGNFALKTSIAKAVGINYPEEPTADGYFIQDCMNSQLISSLFKIQKTLTIHN